MLSFPLSILFLLKMEAKVLVLSPKLLWICGIPVWKLGMRLALQIGVTVKNDCLTLPYQWKFHPYPLLYFESPVSRGRPVYSMLAPFFQELQFSHYSPFQNSNSIAMTIDMHLTLPPGFIEYTRRVSSCKLSTSGWVGQVYFPCLHQNFQELRSW